MVCPGELLLCAEEVGAMFIERNAIEYTCFVFLFVCTFRAALVHRPPADSKSFIHNAVVPRCMAGVLVTQSLIRIDWSRVAEHTSIKQNFQTITLP